MVKEQIVIIFNENKKRYGYRRITKELHNNDICVNHKTVRKLMKQLGLVCQVRAKRKYSSYKGEVGEVAPTAFQDKPAESEMGHRCYRVQSERPETLPVSNS